MTPKAFRRSLADDDPPEALSDVQRALWYGAKGDWKRAHDLVTNETAPDASWVHAWLHRIEGDLDNARYWYGQSGRPERCGPTEEELGEILIGLLAEGG